MRDKEFKAIRTVYSYRFPEVRRLVSDLTREFPHEVYMRSTRPEGGLDDFHESVIDSVVDFYRASAPRLPEFKFRYPTSGSEEGIREVLTLLQTNGTRKIYVWEGDYEGYKEVGRTRGIATEEVDFGEDPKSLEPGFWFLSNPSARDGNIIPNERITGICEAGHKVFYDLAYMGSTRPHEFDLGHPNIFSAVVSFSKPYGLFYDRIGFTFSREPIQALYANKWFKNLLSLMIANKIVAELKPGELYGKYRPLQEQIVAGMNRDFGLGMHPSDALLLGHMKTEEAGELKDVQGEMVERFRRADSYRFCLTRYFQDIIDGGAPG